MNLIIVSTIVLRYFSFSFCIFLTSLKIIHKDPDVHIKCNNECYGPWQFMHKKRRILLKQRYVRNIFLQTKEIFLLISSFPFFFLFLLFKISVSTPLFIVAPFFPYSFAFPIFISLFFSSFNLPLLSHPTTPRPFSALFSLITPLSLFLSPPLP